METLKASETNVKHVVADENDFQAELETAISSLDSDRPYKAHIIDIKYSSVIAEGNVWMHSAVIIYTVGRL